MRCCFIIVVLAFMGAKAFGQFFQFSQYNFTPLRNNPALVGASDYASASLLYRDQRTEGGFHLKSASLNAVYPLIRKKSLRWGGIGLGFMDDRSGNVGMYSRQEASFVYAANLFVTKRQSISLGVRALYQTTSIDLNHLYTGLQYVTDRGFSESLANGEDGLTVRNDYFTFATGMHWQKTDKKSNRVAYAGISFFDINQPDDTFFGSSERLSTTVVGSGGFQMYQNKNLSVNPDILISYNAAGTLFNVGVVTSHALDRYSTKEGTIALLTRYTPGRHGMVGFQFHSEKYSLGISYDFPFLRDNVANAGALEMGIEIHQFKGKRKKKIVTQEKGKTQVKSVPVKTATLERTDTLKPKPVPMNMSERLKHKTDSLIESAVELKKEQAHVLERAIVHVKFEFNSSGLDEESQKYFDELAVALHDNPDLRLNLVGHTDNVGSNRYNLKLSLQRAQTIKDYLTAQGIDEYRISVEGKGLREPLNGNKNDQERALNRRVEVLIVYQEPD